MRLLVTLFSVIAIALATMSAPVGGAMAMEEMTATSMVAKMEMGAADPAACPPKICAKMKECVPASSFVAAVVPAANSVAFSPRIELLRLALPDSVMPDPISEHGLRRPPRLI